VKPLPISFLWPDLLWLQLIVPLLVLAYWWLLRRKKKLAVSYASLSLVKDALGQTSRWRRHVPPLLFLAAIALMLLAAARPMAVITLPSQQDTVILAIDISGSMRAKDVEPTRLEAAQAAARTFITELPRHTRVGIVAFAGTASLVQQPTLSREDALAAIDRLQLQRGTATGSGILVSLATLFPDGGFDVSQAIYGRDVRRAGAPIDGEAKKEKEVAEPAPVPPGSYTQAAIILLSDGQRTTGPDPIEAAKRAANRGVRIYTVGIGTVDGEVISFEGWSFRARLDEETLKAVAGMTAAEYFYASSAAELKKVYQALNARIVFQTKETEVSGLVSAAAAVLALLAGFLSMLWFNRIL
jgi:Ca-activated chloride channel family protein